jgi:hypothetical protein
VLGRREERPKPAFARWKTAIDQACAKLNPVLLAIVIGLAILDVSCYSALQIGRWHSLRQELAPPGALPPRVARSLASGPP